MPTVGQKHGYKCNVWGQKSVHELFQFGFKTGTISPTLNRDRDEGLRRRHREGRETGADQDEEGTESPSLMSQSLLLWHSHRHLEGFRTSICL